MLYPLSYEGRKGQGTRAPPEAVGRQDAVSSVRVTASSAARAAASIGLVPEASP